MNLLRSEWIKLWSVRSHQVMLGVAIATAVGFAVLVAAVIPNDPEQLGPDFDPFTLALAGAGIATLLVGAVGVLLISGEIRHGTTRVTFAAEPHRTRVLAAKGVVAFVAGLLVGLVAVPGSLAAGLGILSARGFDVSVGGFDFWRAAIGAVVLFGLNALVGLGLGTILKSSAAAIVVFAITNVLVEPIVQLLIGRWARFLPFRAGSEVVNPNPVDPGLGWPLGLAYFCGLILVLLAAGAWLLNRRDA
jgi:ABC-type transport system involved in multi-copper enzyme maturation permease subunit